MSADAKVWQDDEGCWHGIHDGECPLAAGHNGGQYDLAALLQEVAECLRGDALYGLRWVLVVYRDGKPGLKGYMS